MMKLDLGCGQNKKAGFVGVDRCEPADVLMDLESVEWPWDVCSVDEIWCSHYVEHTRDLIGFMNRCWSILKPGGIMTINAPYYTSIRAHSDPDHKRLITENTFDYFSKEWRRKAHMDHTNILCDMETVFRALIYTPEWHGKAQEELEHARRNYWNVVSDIQIKLSKK